MTSDITNELNIRAVRNIATKKYFIFLESMDRGQIQVINPTGKTLTVPKHIFEDPVAVAASDFGDAFTNDQLVAYDKCARPRKKATTTRKKTTRKKATTKSKTGLGATWNAPTLTFYKFQIDPLDPKQTFRINLENGDVFEIRKDEFNQVFSDVMLSTEYSRGGAYSYAEVPERAEKFLRKATS